MGPGARFHKDCFRDWIVDKVDTLTHRQQGDLISLLLFFQNEERRLKNITVKKDPMTYSFFAKVMNFEQITHTSER
jgi:hypothetical protein